jgi:hypothetical protein
MPRQQAIYHINRCIQSGLLIKQVKEAEGDGEMETENDRQ